MCFMINRRRFLQTASAALAFSTLGANGLDIVQLGMAAEQEGPNADGASAEQQPNILYVVADDLGWADVGFHGSKIKTPNIDRLCSEGVELTQHYVQPMCTPTRVGLLTGRYPSRFGNQAIEPCNERVLPWNTETLASALASVGYDTGLAGKWHLGSKGDWGPNHFGFARSYGSLAGGCGPYNHSYKKGPYSRTWHRNEELIEEEGHVTDLIGREAVGWINARREPWFYYVPFTAVHIPVKAPEQFIKLYEGETLDADPMKNESYRHTRPTLRRWTTGLGK